MSALPRAAEDRQPAYRFRPMAEGDLPLLRTWLSHEHVRDWWGDTDEQFALVAGDLAEPAMAQFIVHADDYPFAYLQSYDLDAWADPGFRMHPRGTRAIDQFIGAPLMINRGHGSAFIRAFVDGLFAAGVPRVITDPDPENARAVRAYAKAGFRNAGPIETIEGPALLMLRDNPEGH